MPTTLRLSHLTAACALDDFHRLRAEGPAVLLGDKGVGVDRLPRRHRNDHIHVSGPRALGVEPRRLRRVIRVAVVVADDVLAVRVSLALDADVIARVDLVAVTRALDDDVVRAL